MASHHTEPQLTQLVAVYLQEVGRRTFAKLYVLRELKDLARTQDKIGWRNFIKGKISKCLPLEPNSRWTCG